MSKLMEDINLQTVVTAIASSAMIFGGVVPYIPQYREIRRTISCEGFSQHTCLVLLIANLLRIYFWFGKHYELPLLAQSFLMIICMMALMELCVRVNNKSEIIQGRQYRFRENHIQPRSFYQTLSDMDISHFWKWTDFLSYIECLISIAVILSIVTYIFIDFPIYIESIGFLSVFTEALLGTPQLIRNFKRGSSQGMSVTMVIMWLCGDTFKTCYFVLRAAPMQFWLCGGLQIFVDVAILTQVVYYSFTGHAHQ